LSLISNQVTLQNILVFVDQKSLYKRDFFFISDKYTGWGI